MNSNYIDSLADYLHSTARISAYSHAKAGALATASTLCGSGYFFKVPKTGCTVPDSWINEIPTLRDIINSPESFSIVNLNVMLSGTVLDKFEVVNEVERFLRQMDNNYPIAYGIESFTNKNAIWKWGEEVQPLVLFKLENFNGTLRKLHEQFFSLDNGDDLAPEPVANKAYTLATLLMGKHDVVERPIGVKGKEYIPPSPPTILAETSHTALEKKLPSLFEVSPFYGDLLFAPADQEKVVNNHRSSDWDINREPPKELIEWAQKLCARRKTQSPILVRFSEEQEKTIDYLWHDMHRNYQMQDSQFKSHVMNIAALFAIGRDPETPVVNDSDIDEAVRMALINYFGMREGIKSIDS